MKKILIYFGLTLCLIITGFLVWDLFIKFSLLQIEKNDIHIITTNSHGQFKSKLIFAFVVGILPIIYSIVENIGKLRALNQRLVATGIIIICGLFFWCLRIFLINKEIQHLSDFNIAEGIQKTIDFETLNFEIYLLSGFLIGGLISALIFKIKNT